MARNTRLERAMKDAEVTVIQLSRALDVNTKTIHRWLSGSTPSDKHRWAVAKHLRSEADWLWPEAVQLDVSAGDELVAAYTTRSDVPTKSWWEVISRANRQIDLLGYTLYFLSLQHPDLVPVLQAKCAAGTAVRAVIADPESEHVAYRDREEGTPLTLVVRIKTTWDAWRPLLNTEGFGLRFQDVPLYNSVFRFDDHMFVTPHLFGVPGSQAPLLHLKRVGDGGLFSRFAGHFESIWDASRPNEEG